MALEPKQCGSAAEIQAALKAEGQVPVVVGNRVTTRADHDITSPVVPSWALIGNDTKAANDYCRATNAGLCESYDDYVKRATAGGMRVMLMARSEATQTDGSVRAGRWLTVLTKPDRKIADEKATNNIGASESVGGLEDVNYTQFAARFMVAP